MHIDGSWIGLIIGNGRLLNQLASDLGLHIMNCVRKEMSGATWFMADREFTLDYVNIDREGLVCVVEAVIIDEVDVVYNDHAAVSVSIEWKVKNTIKRKKRKHVIKKKNLNSSL